MQFTKKRRVCFYDHKNIFSQPFHSTMRFNIVLFAVIVSAIYIRRDALQFAIEAPETLEDAQAINDAVNTSPEPPTLVTENLTGNATIAGLIKKGKGRKKGLFLGFDLGIFADGKKKHKSKAKFDECMNDYCYEDFKGEKIIRKKKPLAGVILRKLKSSI